MSHKYSDECDCDECAAEFNRVIFAAIEKEEERKKKKERGGKCKKVK